MLTTSIKTEGNHFDCLMKRSLNNQIECDITLKGTDFAIMVETATKDELISDIESMIKDLQEIIDFYGKNKMDMLIRTNSSF